MTAAKSSEKAAKKQRGKPFEPGQSGNPNGRKRGVPNKATAEAKAFSESIVDDPEYRVNLKKAAIERTLNPAIETMLWHYAKGKPKEVVEHKGLASIAEILTAALDPETDGSDE